ncbi:MAG: ATP-binding cassette domain-containing protein [Clostridia bacterium]|nr:ATP-binding cassette domain-containing protein [Clostridia bacterium]
MLEFKGVTKQYLYGAKVLGALDLEIKDGEIIAVVGDEGSGKTTFIKTASAVTDYEGEILLDGKKVESKTDDTMVVFDDLALFKNRSVYFNLAYPLRIRGIQEAEIDKRIKEACEKTGITAVLYSKVKGLSFADKKRVALTRLFLRSVKVIYVDNITSGLTYDEHNEIFSEFSEYVLEKAKEGTIVIYTSTDYKEAIALSDRIIAMHYGEIKQIGTYDELYSCPESIWAAESVDPEYNFEKVQLKDEGGLKLFFGEYEADAECLSGKFDESFIGKEIYAGWHSTDFDPDSARKEPVTKAIRKKHSYLLYAGDKKIRNEIKTETVSTLPEIKKVILYDFLSENSIMK